MKSDKKTIVIVGGGFAGVFTARYLQRYLPSDWDIVLFSQENHFIFTPLLGDVVGSTINPAHVVWPIRQMARKVRCMTATMTDIDFEQREALYKTPDGRDARQPFDHLVLASGSIVNLDIIPGMAAHGMALKTMGDAFVLRNHLIGLLEKAEVETNPEVRKRLLTVIVVGGGFSGVEVAGEVADLLKGSSKYYGKHSPSDIHVILVQAVDRILPELPESLSEFATKKMQKHGIDIRTNALAQSVKVNGIRLKDGSEIEAETVICTIGNSMSPLIRGLELPLERNRLKTEPDMSIAGKDNVWALGDCAAVPNEATGAVSIPTAQLAQRQAKHLAKNIADTIKGKPTKPFSFKPLGMLASIGGHKAVGTVFGFKVSGLLAWFLWRGVYLMKMPTIARKIQIAFDWGWQLIFPRDIVQLNLKRTERLGRSHYEKGQYVFHKGDPGDQFYIIQKGVAGVYTDEKEEPITTLKAGEFFGEGALLRNAPRSASIKAEEDLELLMISSESFAQIAGNLEVFRMPMERALQSAESSRKLLEQAKNNPTLSGLSVREIMSHPVTTLSVSLTFEEALNESRKRGRGAYPVVDEFGKMVGLCTRTDYYNAIQKLIAPETPIGQVMKHPVISVKESETVTDALFKFLRFPIKRLVVISDDESERPIGMLTPFDVFQKLSIEEIYNPQMSSSS